MFPNHDISVPRGRKSGVTSRYHIRVYSLCAALSTVQELFITSPMGAHFEFELLPSPNQSLLN
jgi:hypothetical protein